MQSGDRQAGIALLKMSQIDIAQAESVTNIALSISFFNNMAIFSFPLQLRCPRHKHIGYSHKY